MKTALIVGLSVFASISLFGQNNENQKNEDGWSLVYANNENGNRVSGDLGKLISAIRNGEPIERIPVRRALRHHKSKHAALQRGQINSHRSNKLWKITGITKNN